MGRYPQSDEWYERTLKVTPGACQTLSKRRPRFGSNFPAFLDRGDGAYVWDIDGHKYLDMICSLACMTLGYRRREIDEAVIRQMQNGESFSLATKLECLVSEKICDLIPCAESVRYVRSGSESTEAAIRIARKATGRDLILAVGDGYNSWHQWFQVLKPQHPGIPQHYREMIDSFQYNDLTFLHELPSGYWNDVAAIILEPCHYEQPREGFLEGLRLLCDLFGTVLIFDEMVTGFRFANGGAQEYYGVTPDLACFGKAMANGFPLACVCGRRDLMEHADVVSGTFGGETLSLAACNAVLDIYQSEPIIETLWARGEQFQTGFNDLAHVLDVPIVCDGFAVKPRIRFMIAELGELHSNNTLAMSLFLQETALRGLLWHPAGGNVSAAMTKQDIEFALTGMGEALVVVNKALESGDWSVLQGKPIQASPFVRKA